MAVVRQYRYRKVVQDRHKIYFKALSIITSIFDLENTYCNNFEFECTYDDFSFTIL